LEYPSPLGKVVVGAFDPNTILEPFPHRLHKVANRFPFLICQAAEPSASRRR
jgi:hypothetical protein